MGGVEIWGEGENWCKEIWVIVVDCLLWFELVELGGIGLV